MPIGSRPCDIFLLFRYFHPLENDIQCRRRLAGRAAPCSLSPAASFENATRVRAILRALVFRFSSAARVLCGRFKASACVRSVGCVSVVEFAANGRAAGACRLRHECCRGRPCGLCCKSPFVACLGEHLSRYAGTRCGLSCAKRQGGNRSRRSSYAGRTHALTKARARRSHRAVLSELRAGYTLETGGCGGEAGVRAQRSAACFPCQSREIGRRVLVWRQTSSPAP